jgi:hypothetical protein
MHRIWLSSGIPNSACNLTFAVSGSEATYRYYRPTLRVRSTAVVRRVKAQLSILLTIQLFQQQLLPSLS